MKRFVRKLVVPACVLALAGALGPAPIEAQEFFRLDKMRLELSPQQRVQTVAITNSSDGPKVVELFADRWAQSTGKDTLTEVDDLIVSPSIVKLDAGETRTIRVGVRGEFPKDIESAYRLHFKDVPFGLQVAGPAQVQVVFSYLMPVFVATQSTESADLVWHAKRIGSKELTLSAENLGNRHVRISRIRVFGDAAKTVLLAELTEPAYALAKSQKHWDVKLGQADPSDALVIDAQTDGAPSLAAVSLEK